MSRAENPVELLSAYLDDQLPSDEATRVEALIESDPELREQLAGLRAVSTDLGHLERLAPPPTLGQDVARRIKLAGEQRSLLDRIEDGLSGVQQQSNIFLMFAVIFALASIMYFFFHGLERNQLTPITFVDPAEAPHATDLESATTLFVAERLFRRHGDLWAEEGLAPEAFADARPIDAAQLEATLAQHPELRGTAQLGTVILRLDGEVIKLTFPSTPETGQ
ncbi:MAG: hypothetical protein AAGM22_01050 [Acidobacteriota bacterium]